MDSEHVDEQMAPIHMPGHGEVPEASDHEMSHHAALEADTVESTSAAALNQGQHHQQQQLQFSRNMEEILSELALQNPEPAGQQWKRDEHNRFVHALETYGSTETASDAWKKITAFVQTRSIEEVRLHGKQYLQQLVQQRQQRLLGREATHDSAMVFPLTISSRDSESSTSSSAANNQNDPNGPNQTMMQEKPYKQKTRASGEAAIKTSMKAPNQQQQYSFYQPMLSTALQPKDRQPPGRKTSRRSPKVWTFEEDKAFELALANWNSVKPYSWPKIAASVPGKTAKDVRSRYEELLGDIATIERSNQQGLQQQGRMTRRSSLSSRISPPPPLDISQLGKDGSAFSSAMSLDSPGFLDTKSVAGKNHAAPTPSNSSSMMLSPTFLDFLADEEKHPPLSFAAMGDLPSPLLSSPIATENPNDTNKKPAPITGSANASSSESSSGNPPRNRSTSEGAQVSRVSHDFVPSDDLEMKSTLNASEARYNLNTAREKTNDDSPQDSVAPGTDSQSRSPIRGEMKAPSVRKISDSDRTVDE